MTAKLFVFGIVLVFILTSVHSTYAASKTSEEAVSAVKGWLQMCKTPLSVKIGTEIGTVVQFKDSSGIPLYYAVQLKPNGFVIISADDSIEPIIAFGENSKYSCSTESTLYSFLANDLSNRISILYALETGAITGEEKANFSTAILEAQNKWNCLVAAFESNFPMPLGLTTVDDVNVPSLVQSKWDQGNVCSPAVACYNYYTPPGTAGSTGNYPCGCVATAMAQFMRYHEFPIQPVYLGPFTISVDGTPRSAYLRGEDGVGGPYNWSSMVYEPHNSCGTLTLQQRQAIGAITYDSGVSVQTAYTSSGSSASTATAAWALVDVFGYNTSRYASHYNMGNIGAGLDAMIIPNLDMLNPVILGVTGGPGGHALVCDGYGYNTGTLYYHLNLGWSGVDNAWYNLPTIDTHLGTFDTVHTCVYNVYIDGTGELIGGRVLEADGDPYWDVIVRATKQGGGVYEAATSVYGTYAIKVPSNSTYDVTVVADLNWTARTVSTTQSTSPNLTCGNVFGVDFKPRAVEENPGTVFVREGDTVQFGVRLNQEPEGDVVVSVTGNSQIQIISPASGSLTFTTTNWDTYQYVNVYALHDSDAISGGGFFSILSASGWTCPVTVFFITDDDTEIVTDTSAVNVPEGGTATFRVKLKGTPFSDVTVSVAYSSGDTDISVQSGASLIFTNLNWDNYQTVTLAAAEDADQLDGSAVISCTSPG